MIDLGSLNENQLEAVNWQEGPLLVIAGPGSGKTRVLTYRIARIIEASQDDTFRILGLTFTNKAASEMRTRIEELVPNAGARCLLTTFHSFAGDILRQHGHLIGLRPDFTILAQDSERIALLDEVLSDIKLENVESSSERLLPVIGRLLDYGADTQTLPQFLKTLPKEQQNPIAQIYLAYRARMINENCLDFGGLIAESLALLRSRPAVKKQIQRVYRYICVDEFQDTNLSQYELLQHVVNIDTKNLFVVADDDQIIYQWNGASPERLIELKRNFDMRPLQLPANYRCPPEVIEIANRLIINNSDRSAEKQKLQAKKAAGDVSSIRIYMFGSFNDEAGWVADDIKSRSIHERARCVVLGRTRKLLEHMVQSLEAVGVAAYLAMRKDEFVSAPMQWLHGILRLANAPQDREHLKQVCKAFYAIEGVQLDVKDITSSASTLDGNFLRAFTRSALLRRSDLRDSSIQVLEHSVPLLLDRLDFQSFISEAFAWMDEMQKDGQTDDSFSEYSEEKITWNELQSEITAQYGSEQMNLHLLLQELDMRSKAPKPVVDAVPCFTIHASKGMEFGHVYLIGLVEDQLPSWAAIKKGNNSHEIQEERRNCFVAITRTEDTLTLSYSARIDGWEKRPSRFLSEMGFAVS